MILYTCPICEKSYTTRRELDEHMRENRKSMWGVYLEWGWNGPWGFSVSELHLDTTTEVNKIFGDKDRAVASPHFSIYVPDRRGIPKAKEKLYRHARGLLENELKLLDESYLKEAGDGSHS